MRLPTTVQAPEGFSGISREERAGDGFGALQKVDQYLEECRALYRNPLVSRKTQEEYERMLQKLREKGEEEQLRENVGYLRETLKEAEEYASDFHKRLNEAAAKHWISEKSRNESLQWFWDHGVLEMDRKRWVREEFPQYLKDRGVLAKEREALLKDPRLEGVRDSQFRAQVDLLRDDRRYFDELEYSQRKNLVDTVRALLSVQESDDSERRKLYAQAEEMLRKATEAPRPALHRDKVGTWLKRIFESGASAEEIRAFLEGTREGSLQKLIETWRNVAIQFWTLRKDPAFQGVKTQFINTKAFLWLHYDERVSYVAGLRGQAERAKALRARAMQCVDSAEHAGALDAEGMQRWMTQYVFNGKHTLEELESIIGGNLTERLERKVALVRRFERASDEAYKVKGIRGMPLPEKSTFLKLHYDHQLATVLEMEMRLGQIRRQRPNLLLLRHFMDREEWESALELIEEARQKPGLSFDDDRQLTSMEYYIKLHWGETSGEHERVRETLSEAQQIDRLIDEISSPSLEYLCILLCERGSESIGALGWTSYNRDWCNKHGYLNPKREHEAIRKGKAEALARARRKKRGVVSETIQGETGEQEYIELSRSAATNVCVDIMDAGAMRAFAETLYQRRKDHRALYWTNAIFHRGGVLMDLGEQNEETRRMYKMRNLLRKLEAKGQHYQYRGTSQEVAKTVTFPSSGRGERALKKAA